MQGKSCLLALISLHALTPILLCGCRWRITEIIDYTSWLCRREWPHLHTSTRALCSWRGSLSKAATSSSQLHIILASLQSLSWDSSQMCHQNSGRSHSQLHEIFPCPHWLHLTGNGCLVAPKYPWLTSSYRSRSRPWRGTGLPPRTFRWICVVDDSVWVFWPFSLAFIVASSSRSEHRALVLAVTVDPVYFFNHLLWNQWLSVRAKLVFSEIRPAGFFSCFDTVFHDLKLFGFVCLFSLPFLLPCEGWHTFGLLYFALALFLKSLISVPQTSKTVEEESTNLMFWKYQISTAIGCLLDIHCFNCFSHDFSGSWRQISLKWPVGVFFADIHAESPKSKFTLQRVYRSKTEQVVSVKQTWKSGRGFFSPLKMVWVDM